MRIIIITSFIVFPGFAAFGQWHDNIWNKSEKMVFSFNTFPPSIIPTLLKLDFNNSNLTMNSADGNFLFYTNGIQIHDADDTPMPNGDSLNAGEVAYALWLDGYSCSYCEMGLPSPANPLQYYLVHHTIEYNDSTGVNSPDILYTIIDMSLNNGKGAVVSKNNLIKRVFWVEASAATKHANGQDWWVLTPDYGANKIYRFRLTDTGIVDTATQIIGYKPLSPDSTGSAGQNIFSPDGSVFVDFDGRNGIRIYDFDRCTGELSNFRWVQFPYPQFPNVSSTGAAISPNSRFLYVDQRNYIFQLDLWADDIAASLDTVAVYDGFESPPLIYGIFIDMMPTPDGKIYVFNPTKYLHVINKPNEKGTKCDIRLHSLLLPDYSAGGAYYPNYRLGPLDGSPCDTLGLDNHPLAGFTWEAIDSLQPLLVEFADNSFYEPSSWFWNFGDGGTSTEVNPLHTFPAGGVYHVCLTASNQYDSDTFCREVPVGTVGTREREGTFSFSLWPNPAKEVIQLRYTLPPGRSAEWRLFDALGREVKKVTLPEDTAAYSISLGSQPAGLYFYQTTVCGNMVKSGKLTVKK